MAKLYAKYSIHRLRPTPENKVPQSTLLPNSVDIDNINSPFVLMPRKDPVAMIALECYADACESRLAKEIKKWIQQIKQAPKVLGTQGRRNIPFMRQ